MADIVHQPQNLQQHQQLHHQTPPLDNNNNNNDCENTSKSHNSHSHTIKNTCVEEVEAEAETNCSKLSKMTNSTPPPSSSTMSNHSSGGIVFGTSISKCLIGGGLGLKHNINNNQNEDLGEEGSEEGGNVGNVGNNVVVRRDEHEHEHEEDEEMNGVVYKIFVGGLGPTTCSNSLRVYFEKLSGGAENVLNAEVKVQIDDSTGISRSRGFGFVQFVSECFMQRALDLKKVEIDGKWVEIKRVDPGRVLGTNELRDMEARKIFVGGLHRDVDDIQLRHFFEEIMLINGIIEPTNAVEEVKVVIDCNNQKSRGFAYVTFRDLESMHCACDHPKNNNIIKGKWIDIKPSSRGNKGVFKQMTLVPAHPAAVSAGQGGNMFVPMVMAPDHVNSFNFPPSPSNLMNLLYSGPPPAPVHYQYMQHVHPHPHAHYMPGPGGPPVASSQPPPPGGAYPHPHQGLQHPHHQGHQGMHPHAHPHPHHNQIPPVHQYPHQHMGMAAYGNGYV